EHDLDAVVCDGEIGGPAGAEKVVGTIDHVGFAFETRAIAGLIASSLFCLANCMPRMTAFKNRFVVSGYFCSISPRVTKTLCGMRSASFKLTIIGKPLSS